MCENAYLSIKNPKASRALKWALEPGRRLLNLLTRLHSVHQQLLASEAGAPSLTKSWIRTCVIFVSLKINVTAICSRAWTNSLSREHHPSPAE